METICAEVQQKTGAQIAVVTVNSLDGESKEDYAADLYKQLGVGPKKDNRGVLVLLAPSERQYRIEVGYGLEPVINDARAGDIGRAMVPDLRQQDLQWRPPDRGATSCPANSGGQGCSVEWRAGRSPSTYRCIATFAVMVAMAGHHRYLFRHPRNYQSRKARRRRAALGRRRRLGLTVVSSW